jgi:hypothetical protein
VSQIETTTQSDAASDCSAKASVKEGQRDEVDAGPDSMHQGSGWCPGKHSTARRGR